MFGILFGMCWGPGVVSIRSWRKKQFATSRGRLKSRDPHLAGEKHPTNRMMDPIDEHIFQMGGLTT
jgi:hypothetical protein